MGHGVEGIRVRAEAVRTVLRFFAVNGVYEDRAADYVTSEPAIVYAASAVLLFAAMAA